MHSALFSFSRMKVYNIFNRKPSEHWKFLILFWLKIDKRNLIDYNINYTCGHFEIMENQIKNLEIQNKISNEDIKSMIYTIRGKQVMIDSDVAMLYHYETKNINKAMKRNMDRFPEDFCFQLTKEELDRIWFQNGTKSKNENAKLTSNKSNISK